MRTFGNMDPAQDDQVNAEAISILLHSHRELAELIAQAAAIDPGKVKVQSLVRLIRFRLGDAIDFLLAHEERHLLQALRAAGELP